MLPEQKIEISKARFDHAKECLLDAKMLLTGERYRSAANRAYYAIFHAMRAVLALDGVDMKHHSGIISEFRKRYIKTGILTQAFPGSSRSCRLSARAATTMTFSLFPRQKPSSRCRQRKNFCQKFKPI